MWTTLLRRLLSQRTSKSAERPRVAVVGVGNPMRSDDAAGILIARALSKRECAADQEHLLVIEGGPAPENRTGELRTFSPDLVLIIDAANMGEMPGAIRWIDEETIDGMSASTHSLPLSMLAHYLTLDLNCDVKLLGIQVGSNDVGEDVSAEVLQAVDDVADELDTSIRADRASHL